MYKIKGLLQTDASNTFFTLTNRKTGEERSISVLEYYRQQRQQTIRYTRANLVETSISKPDKPHYLVPELCTVVPGQKRHKIVGEQTSQMIRVAAMKPGDRFRSIEEHVQQENLDRHPKLE